jgi:hypothetical protein
MAASERDQILVRLLRCAEALPEMRHRAFLEWDHRRHRAQGYAHSG